MQLARSTQPRQIRTSFFLALPVTCSPRENVLVVSLEQLVKLMLCYLYILNFLVTHFPVCYIAILLSTPEKHRLTLIVVCAGTQGGSCTVGTSPLLAEVLQDQPGPVRRWRRNIPRRDWNGWQRTVQWNPVSLKTVPTKPGYLIANVLSFSDDDNMPEWVDYLDYTVSFFEYDVTIMQSLSPHSTMATLGWLQTIPTCP